MLHLYKFDDITEAHLQSLIVQGVREGTTLDYKRAINLKEPAARAELLRDITSFANSAGGHIVVGMEEGGGLPIRVEGFSADYEKLEQQVTQTLRSQVDPPITGLRMRVVPLENGNSAFLLRIDKTWNGPHMIKLDGENRCWTRDHSGKRMMNISDLKQAIAYSEGAADRMKRFRMERIGNVLARETPIPLSSDRCIMLHLLPLVSFTGNPQVNFSDLNDGAMRPMHDNGGWSPTFTFEGKLTSSSSKEGPATTYMLVFRNGVIEAVESSSLEPRTGGGKDFCSWHFEMLCQGLRAALDACAALSVQTPVFGAVSLTCVRDYQFFVPQEYGCRERQPLNRDVLALPEFLVEDFGAEPRTILKATFDIWSQSCGYPSLPEWVTNSLKRADCRQA